MRLTRARVALLAVLVVVLAGAATAATWAATRGGGARGTSTPAGHGPGMTGGHGPGMTGGEGDRPPGGGEVGSLDAARDRAQAFGDRLGLKVGEVIQFDNGFYVELLAPDGQGATEVLVNAETGLVGPEHGPATMWNTRYGMHPRSPSGAVTVPAAQATRSARQWLAAQRSAGLAGLTTADPTAFPGYYTMETLAGGRIVSMMSVNAYTGAVWYHTWHGRFVASKE
jgi:hypothetical protein